MYSPDEPDVINDHKGIRQDFISQIVYFPIILYIRLFRQALIENLRKRQNALDVSEPAINYASISGHMHAVCAAKNIKFYAILQPANGIGMRNLTETDRVLLKFAQSKMVTNNQSRLGFFIAYYRAIRRLMSGRPYFVDFSEVFSDNKDQVFFDSVHFSDKGQRIVAESLCKLIRENEKE